MKYKTLKFHFLITIIMMLANILSVLWTPNRNRKAPTHPKCGSDVKTDNAYKPRKHEKVYYLHIRLSRESRANRSGWSETGLKQ